MQPKRPSESKITLAQTMGPQDANNHGNVHGGVLMKLCDEAGALAAVKHARKPCVTVAIDRMSFQAPVSLGDLVTFEAEVTWVGRTSVEAQVIVRAERIISGEVMHTNTAHILYVALDGVNGKSSPVPPLLIETDDEKLRYEAAKRRQEMRLKLRESAVA